MKILITGASSGIGKDLAKIAAKRSFDVVLVARSKDKLDELAQELESANKISTEVIAKDLTTQDGCQTVVDRLAVGDIDILINNAGFGSSGPFVELDIENEINQIELNINALVRLSHAGANAMKKKNMGTIVNISSVASYQPMTGNAVYGATKSFVTSFSHALREELRAYGVNVTLVCPGTTRTDFFERSKWDLNTKDGDHLPEFMWQSSQEVAESIFHGIDHHRGVVIPGLINKVLAGVSSSLPSSVTRKITAYVAKGRRTR